MGNFALQDDIFQKKAIEIHAFHKIAGQKFDVVEFREIENMRLQEHGRGDIHFVAYIHEIGQKMRIIEFFVRFIDDWRRISRLP